MSTEQQQQLLDELAKRGASSGVPVGGIQIIKDIAFSGGYVHPWTSLQPLLEARLTQVLDEANARVSDCPDRPCETFKERRQQLVDALQAFDEAPFTLQRLCEILLEPDRQYKSTNKLVAGIDKLLCVSSTYPPCDPSERSLRRPEEPAEGKAGSDTAATGSAAAVSGAGRSGSGGNDGVAAAGSSQEVAGKVDEEEAKSSARPGDGEARLSAKSDGDGSGSAVRSAAGSGAAAAAAGLGGGVASASSSGAAGAANAGNGSTAASPSA